MTENVQLEQSVSEWKDEALGDSNPPRSLEEIAFILSAGVFGAVLAYSGSRLLLAHYFIGIPFVVFSVSPWGSLIGAFGGAVGAAFGAAMRGPYGGVFGALLGSVIGMVALPLLDIAAVFVIPFLFW